MLVRTCDKNLFLRCHLSSCDCGSALKVVLKAHRCGMWQGVTAPDRRRQAQWEGVPGAIDQGVREGAWEGALASANLKTDSKNP